MSMQVEVKSNGLERRVTVALPAEKVKQEIENRLKSLSRRVKVDGFRAGKVPMKVVERKWGGTVRQEVRSELLQSSFYEAINQEKLRPAGTPHFDLQPETPEAGLRYTAVFEVYPEFEVNMPKDIKVVKPTAVIGESDIDAMVEKLRSQRKAWVEAVRPAALPEVNEEFIKSFGVQDGSREAFRAEVKKTMERELEQATKDRVKAQVLDALLQNNPIELPKALIDEEIGRMKGQIEAGDGSAMEEQARRRVALGLIIAELIKKNQFKAEPGKVRAAVEAVAASYERPEEVVQWYYERRERLNNVEALLLEEQAVNWVVEQNAVEVKSTPFAELVDNAPAG